MARSKNPVGPTATISSVRHAALTLHLKNAGFNNDGTAESLATAAGDDAEQKHKLCALIVLYMDSIETAYPDNKNHIQGCFVRAVTKELYKALPLDEYKVFGDGVARDVSASNESGDDKNNLEYFKEWPEEVFRAITKKTPAQYFEGEAAAEPATSSKRKTAEPATSGKRKKAKADEKQERGEGNVPASPRRPSAEKVRKMNKEASEAKNKARPYKAPTTTKRDREVLDKVLGVPVRGPGSPPSKKASLNDEMEDASGDNDAEASGNETPTLGDDDAGASGNKTPTLGDDDQPSTLARIRDLMPKATEVLDLMQTWDRAALDDAMTKCVSEFPTNEDVLELADKFEEESELAKKNLKAMIDLEKHVNAWNAALDEQLASGDVSEHAKLKEEVEALEKALGECETMLTEVMLQMKNLVTLAELAVRVQDDDNAGGSGDQIPGQSAGPVLPGTPPRNNEADGKSSAPPRAPVKGEPPKRSRLIGPEQIDTWRPRTAARSLDFELPPLCFARALSDLGVDVL